MPKGLRIKRGPFFALPYDKKPMNWRTASAFVAVGVIWGSAWIATSLVLPQVPGLYAGAMRFAVAAAFATLLALMAHLRSSRQSRKRLAPVLVPSLVLGVTMVSLPYALTVWAAGTVSPGVVATLFAFMPLAALLLSKDGASKAIPIVVTGVGGVALLVAQGLSTSTAQLKGALLIAGAVGLGAFSLNYARKRMGQVNLTASVAIQFAVTAILVGALSLATEPRKSIVWSEQLVVSLLILGMVVSGATLPLVYWLLTKLETWQVAALQWIATLVAVAEAAWFLRAKLSMETWAGAGIVLGATAWLLRGDSEVSEEGVTLRITNHSFDASMASESEVRSDQ
jgi:drug/metabolite transporter (DMT)-like permease